MRRSHRVAGMSRYSTLQQVLGLVGWLVLTGVAAAVGAVASSDAPVFYGRLDLPSWAPPASVFGPVWTALYLMMAVAAWLVWRRHGFRGARGALALFVGQLALNGLWSWLFFAWRRGALAFAEIVLLWLVLVATVVAFRRLHAIAAALLLPYLAWVTFAGALTLATWQANPDLLGAAGSEGERAGACAATVGDCERATESAAVHAAGEPSVASAASAGIGVPRTLRCT